MPQTAYNNSDIHYTINGTGNALVLLHGFLESNAIYKPLTEELAKTHTVVAIDLPGHGQTGCFDNIHSMELMADVVHTVLEAEGISKAGFTGHSMGGYVALAFLRKYPEMVTHLMLLNSVANEDSPEKKANRDRGIKVVQQMPENFISMGVMNLFSEAHKESFATEIQTLKQEALKTPVEGVTAALAGMRDRPDSVTLLKNTNIKKHYIIGTEDPTIDVSAIIEQADEVGAGTTVVEGGHMSYLENKDETLQAMLSFFEN
ncbi:alpha/beta fold hydrolase [Neptunitalea lumnitzerae]|uniref:Alpha/beta hydrolase n=1 Tax=Neptunitalea lumnitzerae TaxID=2965509 RepID=A0ABQ5MEZ1_9FLAO|nr:alpha/beta hydrolase [Neptunitalea sp. Y10]GLB47943.1 alpha/beta hydrolase [Neptunitalea sp. Y10]